MTERDSKGDDAERLATKKLNDAISDVQLTAYESGDGTSQQRPQSSSIDSAIAALLPKTATPPRSEEEKMAQVAATLTGAGGAGSSSSGSARSDRDNQWLKGQAQASSKDDGPLLAVAAPTDNFIRQGWSIPCVQTQPLKSDAPNTIRCMVTTDVYSSNSKSIKMIPWGSTFVGSYSTAVAVGQSYLLAAYTKLYFPNNAWISLGSMPAGDAQGYGGLEASVDNHFLQMFGASLAISAAQLIAGRNQSSTGGVTLNIQGGGMTPSTLTQSGAQDLSTVVQSILQRNANIPPTLKLGPGEPVTVIVNHDMVIDPHVWGGR
jgi:type IV secretion system protein VirB10